MYGLDNASGVNTMPALAPVSSPTPLWFTEGGAGLAASYPGQDWFNMVQAELLGVLTAGGIKPEKGKLNQLTEAIKKIVNSAGFQPSGNYATTQALNNGLALKFDKTSVVQGAGTSTTQVMSQDAATKVFLQPGAFGLGASVFGIAPPSSMNANEIETSGFYGGAGSGGSNWFYNTGPMLTMIRKGGGDGSGTVNQLQCSSRELAFRVRIENQWSEWINTLTSKNTLSDRNGNLKLLGTSELSDCQVGIPLPWPQATAPAGYLICNGQSFNKTSYPLLAKAYPSGQLPDLRGEFIRGLDAGRNVDSGRAVLSSQLDQMQRITGQTLAGATYSDANFIGGAFSFKNELTVPNYPSTDRTEGSGKVYFDSATSPNARVSKDTTGETRPRNIAFLYIVRAA